uniref:Uncharacterized protein n=1 Tax=Anguilla anguilla TaxID=7936 RepID=A0A0E9RTL7_ANGAN
MKQSFIKNLQSICSILHTFKSIRQKCLGNLIHKNVPGM